MNRHHYFVPEGTHYNPQEGDTITEPLTLEEVNGWHLKLSYYPGEHFGICPTWGSYNMDWEGDTKFEYGTLGLALELREPFELPFSASLGLDMLDLRESFGVFYPQFRLDTELHLPLEF